VNEPPNVVLPVKSPFVDRKIRRVVGAILQPATRIDDFEVWIDFWDAVLAENYSDCSWIKLNGSHPEHMENGFQTDDVVFEASSFIRQKFFGHTFVLEVKKANGRGRTPPAA
jgi:hypothetical protein